MHPEARDFTLWAKQTFPASFTGKRVLDVGAADVNGNNRFLFDDCEYEGNDVAQAKNVTIVSRTKDLPFENASFDTIISTECFEHDPEYADSWRKVYSLLKPGGLFCFTCASTGRPEHGTRRTTPQDSIGTGAEVTDMQDYYQNLTLEDLREVFSLDADFPVWSAYYNAHSKDLYFAGVKAGGSEPSPTGHYQSPGVKLLGFRNT